ncbi:hypothetical protein [Motiliproteus sp. SC1-56]|uniref:hypothetical protein n=1 Tax=Motiliproteus sp. SC1-56 TaxID=2799565 RepID=UPI001A905B91|nr:hypothetical protein [Motiliproteus sp. SC1-56]
MPLDLMEPLFLVLGFLVFLASLTMFIIRTKNIQAVLKFWQADIAFTHKEFVINRIGITIMVMGIVLRFFNAWAIA